MAKYIRTKDRIREIIEDFGGSCNVKSTYSKGRPSIDNFTVVSGVRFAPRADTIEELCDRCIVIRQFDDFYKIGSFYECEYEIDCFKRKVKSNNPIIAIYGAIWTDKGLIYVAKMNEKGELCLI